MSAGLALLALRRALPPGALIAAGLLAAAFLATTWEPGALEVAALSGALDPLAAASALARQGLWTALLGTLGPFLVARAAGALPTWRRGEVDWLFASARSRGALALSTLVGLVGAALLLALGCGLVAELGAGPAGPARALAARFSTPAVSLRGESPLVRRVDPGRVPPGALLRVRLEVLGGRSADVRASLRPLEAGAGTQATRVHLASTRALELDLPPSSGALELVLERLGGDALVALAADGIEVVVPTTGPRAIGTRLALRAWLVLSASVALALGFGAWTSAPTAFLGVLALTVAALLSDHPLVDWLPWPGLRDALALAGEDLAAPWPSPRAWLIALGAAAGGLVLATLGLRSWRRAA